MFCVRVIFIFFLLHIRLIFSSSHWIFFWSLQHFLFLYSNCILDHYHHIETKPKKEKKTEWSIYLVLVSIFFYFNLIELKIKNRILFFLSHSLIQFCFSFIHFLLLVENNGKNLLSSFFLKHSRHKCIRCHEFLFFSFWKK